MKSSEVVVRAITVSRSAKGASVRRGQVKSYVARARKRDGVLTWRLETIRDEGWWNWREFGKAVRRAKETAAEKGWYYVRSLKQGDVVKIPPIVLLATVAAEEGEVSDAG